jgi:hypothetical protein
VGKLRAILSAAWLGGIIAATIDIGAAMLINSRPAIVVLHTIAGGLLAERAFAGGMATALLGLALQELMGILIAAVYVGAALRHFVLVRRWFAAGLGYGVVIFVVMNYVVIPLSAWHRLTHFASAARFFGNLLAMLLFGVIVAFFASRMLGNGITRGAAPAGVVDASGR